MPKQKQKKPRKGFNRSKNEWEETIAGHIGRAIDRIPIIDGLIYGALAYLGATALKDPLGALWGPISLKLAISGNVVSGTAGLLGLSLIGLSYPATKEEIVISPPEPAPEEPEGVKCPPGYTLVYSIGAGWRCIKFPPGFMP